MKAKTITYEKLVNKGNYEHEKFGITLELEKGDKAVEVMQKAIDFIHNEISKTPQYNKINYIDSTLPF